MGGGGAIRGEHCADVHDRFCNNALKDLLASGDRFERGFSLGTILRGLLESLAPLRLQEPLERETTSMRQQGRP